MRKFNFFIVIPLIILSSYTFLISQDIKNREGDASQNIDITVTVEKELFPVIAKFISEGNEHYNISDLVDWNIFNKNIDSIQITIISEIPEWTSPVITNIILAPNERKHVKQTPFGINLLSNSRTVPTTIVLTAKIDNNVIYEETQNLNVRPANDMIWSLHTSWDTENFIAAWVTPNDAMVASILAIAKDRLLNNTLAGYKSSDLVAEIRAIFNAVRNSKVSYVDSHMSFGQVGFTQRVRLPKESISQRSANCIDGAVLFASLFENIGLEPVIVLIPGHAFVGVRTSPNSREIWFIETTLVGRSKLKSILTLKTTFNAAVEEGLKAYTNAMQSNPQSVHIIDIKHARSMGIFPLW